MKLTSVFFSLTLALTMPTAYSAEKKAVPPPKTAQTVEELEADPQQTKALYGIGVLGFAVGTYSQCKGSTKDYLAAFEKELIRASSLEAVSLNVSKPQIKSVYVAAVKEGKGSVPAPSSTACAQIKEELDSVQKNMAAVK